MLGRISEKKPFIPKNKEFLHKLIKLEKENNNSSETFLKVAKKSLCVILKVGTASKFFLLFSPVSLSVPPNVNPSRDKHSLVNSPKAATLRTGKLFYM